MGWTFSGCTVDDAAALAINNAAAFWTQPYWRMIWPADAQLAYITQEMGKRMAARVLLIDHDERRHEKAVDEDTGAIVGYARWLLPPALRSEWTEGQVPDVSDKRKKTLEELADSAVWNPGAGTNINTDVLDAKVTATKQRILAEREFIQLDYLAVHPDNQGRGVATSLVQRGIRQAERLRRPIFVMAFDVSRGVYLRQGFREVEQLLQDDRPYGGSGNYNTYFLVYEPASYKAA
ncbi:hypothetical protein MFIFM68171_10169 [Madurella fahalii]|uniref:N-acetyltransferase domain-containing protein n=1 Tax=Madurella fahalii TaxID=1157608 RepID=A0ABQ0GQH8_9PEZI